MIALFSITFLYIFFSAVHSQQDYYQLDLERNLRGQYYATVYIGKPPQPQSVVIDNLQTFMSINCKGCISCKYSERHEPYSIESSFTGNYIQCKEKISICKEYCKGKSSAQRCQPKVSSTFGIYSLKMATDDVGFESQSNSIFRPYFSCVNTESLNVDQYENGVLGLARSQLNIFKSLLKLKEDKSFNQIGFCFGEGYGSVEVGNIPNTYQNKSWRLPMHQQKDFGISQIRDIQFGNESILFDKFLKNTGMIILTRSPQTIFPNPAYQKVIQQIKSICESINCTISSFFNNELNKNQTCISFSEESLDLNSIFPAFIFSISSQIMISWNASQFMTGRQQEKPENTYCLAFTNSSIERYVLGLSFLQNKRVVVDFTTDFIYLQQNYDCSKESREIVPFSQRYYLFLSIGLVLLIRNWIARMAKKCRRGGISEEQSGFVSQIKVSKDPAELNNSVQMK